MDNFLQLAASPLLEKSAESSFGTAVGALHFRFTQSELVLFDESRIQFSACDFCDAISKGYWWNKGDSLWSRFVTAEAFTGPPHKNAPLPLKSGRCLSGKRRLAIKESRCFIS